jgi:hypothetical protein
LKTAFYESQVRHFDKTEKSCDINVVLTISGFVTMKTLLAIATAVALTASPSLAATYSATSAVGSGSDHSVWLNYLGSDSDFSFDPAGIFMLDEGTGLGSLKGTAKSQTQDGGFEVHFNYSTDLSLYNNNPRFKSENGSSEMDDTFYLTMTGGTLMGYGHYAGIDFNTSTMPIPGDDTFATQVGTTANNKNDKFGLANWFFVNTAVDGSCSNSNVNLCNIDGTQGDINIDLAPVPLPAAGFLLLAAIGGFGAFGRRKP